MYRIDDPSASPTLPTPEAALTEGYWTEGNPGTGTPATLERASWFNMVQEELRAIPVAAGVVPSKTVYNQILTALKSMFASVVGSARNLTMSISTASATGTMTADEIIVETALGGQTYRLASFSKTINLATTGAGGMDTGTAPASGFVALYAIYNPAIQTAALLATNAATLQPNVYGGVNMPAGYTASALVGVWPTNSSKQFVAGYQSDRDLAFVLTTAATTSTAFALGTPINLSALVPLNARSVGGLMSVTGTNTQNAQVSVASSASGLGQQQVAGNSTSTTLQNVSSGVFANLKIITPQTIYWGASYLTGTFGGGSVFLSSYSI